MSAPSSSRVVVLTALIWAACLFVVPFGLRIVLNYVNQAVNYQLDPATNGFIPTLVFGLPVAGALAGYGTARQMRHFVAGLSILRIAVWGAAVLFLSVILAILLINLFMPPPSLPLLVGEAEPPIPWPPIFLRLLARDFVLGLFSGSVGGLLLAYEIGRKVGQDSRRMSKITAGWGLGFALANMLVHGIFNSLPIPAPSGALGWLVQDAFSVWLRYGFTGLIAGALGAWATIRAVRPAAQPPAEIASVLQAPGV
jgi:hypothetical protein